MFKIKYPFLSRYHLFKLKQACVQLGLLWVNFRVINNCMRTLRMKFFLMKITTHKVKKSLKVHAACNMKGIRCERIVSNPAFFA